MTTFAMQLSTEWRTDQDMEDESKMQTDWRSEFDLSESRVEDIGCWRLFDNVLRNSRSEEFSCGCFSSVHSHWRSRRESSELGGVTSVRF